MDRGTTGIAIKNEIQLSEIGQMEVAIMLNKMRQRKASIARPH
jgi:hypothetical protein